MGEDRYERFDNLLESNQSDPEVLFQIGLCYLNGDGTEKDEKVAEEYIRNAAELGHAEAKAILYRSEPTETTVEERLEEVNDRNLPEWCERAEDGDAQAQYEVAMFWLTHKEYSADAEANLYLAASAEQGYPLACFALAKEKLYTEPQIAMGQLANAADCRFVEAMYLLAQCYALGWGVEQNAELAEQWFANAAETGDADYKLNLALRYRDGIGVSKSIGKAMSWVSKAQAYGIENAVEAYAARKTIPGELEKAFLCTNTYEHMLIRYESAASKAQIFEYLKNFAEHCDAEVANQIGQYYLSVEDYTEVFFWYKHAADKGLIAAQKELALIYLNGKGETCDKAYGAALLERAALQGDGDAMLVLADCYSNGVGVDRNLQLAAHWYQKSAEKDNSIAQYKLSKCYGNGIGLPQDTVQSIWWLERAALGNMAIAQYELGERYLKGTDVVQDVDKALILLQIAAEQGEVDAQCTLAEHYYKNESYTSAVYWYTQAAQNGCEKAQIALGNMYFEGTKVEQNFSLSMQFLCEAAKNGSPKAYYQLKKNLASFSGYATPTLESDYYLSYIIESRRYVARRVTKVAHTTVESKSCITNADSYMSPSEESYWVHVAEQRRHEETLARSKVTPEMDAQRVAITDDINQCIAGYREKSFEWRWHPLFPAKYVLQLTETVNGFKLNYDGKVCFSSSDTSRVERIDLTTREGTLSLMNIPYINSKKESAKSSVVDSQCYAEEKTTKAAHTTVESKPRTTKINSTMFHSDEAYWAYVAAERRREAALEACQVTPEMHARRLAIIPDIVQCVSTYKGKCVSWRWCPDFPGEYAILLDETVDEKMCVHYGEAFFSATDAGRVEYVQINKRGEGSIRLMNIPYINSIKSSAESGDGTALEHLSNLYGSGILKDDEAEFWLGRAAENGQDTAALKLAEYYSTDEQHLDECKAVFWYQRSADLGNATAQLKLGDNCFYGNGVVQDFETAASWYLLAAEQNNPSAQYKVALCFMNGQGVEADESKAFYWLGKAAVHGEVAAKYLLGNCYYCGKGVEQDYKAAVFYYFCAAIQGDADAQYSLANCYLDGIGVNRNVKGAKEWLVRASANGHAGAQQLMAKIDEQTNRLWNKLFRNSSDSSLTAIHGDEFRVPLRTYSTQMLSRETYQKRLAVKADIDCCLKNYNKHLAKWKWHPSFPTHYVILIEERVGNTIYEYEGIVVFSADNTTKVKCLYVLKHGEIVTLDNIT